MDDFIFLDFLSEISRRILMDFLILAMKIGTFSFTSLDTFCRRGDDKLFLDIVLEKGTVLLRGLSF